jgi:hypothetical protein
MAERIRAYHSSAAAAINDFGPFDKLLNDVTANGIEAITRFPNLVLVPSLAPFNCKTGTAPKVEWTTLLDEAVVIVSAPNPGAPFATFASSVKPASACLQQVLRGVGKVPFVVAVVSSGPACGTMAELERLAPCEHCRGQHAEALDRDPSTAVQHLVKVCHTCSGRYARLLRFMGFDEELLAAAIQHHADHSDAEPVCLWTRVSTEDNRHARRGGIPCHVLRNSYRGVG